MATPRPDLSVLSILDARARLGEGPVWDAASQTLFWVDVYNHRVHRFDPATGKTTTSIPGK